MKKLLGLLAALAVGAGAMYFLDPDQGRRRRALVGDRVNHLSHDARDYISSRRKRVADRVRGVLARVRGNLERREPPSDQRLDGQIRAHLGRLVSYPHAIHTAVHEGRVTMRGDVLDDECDLLFAEVRSMVGVVDVDDRLARHKEPGRVPSLQGRPRRRSRAEIRRLARSTATFLALAGGIGTAVRAMRSPVEGSSHAGMLSLSIALLAYGVGDGAQRLVRRRRYRVAGGRPRPTTHVSEINPGLEQSRAEEGDAALLTPPSSWH